MYKCIHEYILKVGLKYLYQHMTHGTDFYPTQSHVIIGQKCYWDETLIMVLRRSVAEPKLWSFLIPVVILHIFLIKSNMKTNTFIFIYIVHDIYCIYIWGFFVLFTGIEQPT